jgi:hypothetical protein
MINKFMFVVFILGSSYLYASDVVSYNQHEDVSLVQEVDQQVVHKEENEVTKGYLTALALDGMRKFYRTGLEFLDGDRKFSNLVEIEQLMACAFQHALISHEKNAWDDQYIDCIKNTKLISGNIYYADNISYSPFLLNHFNDLNFFKSTGMLSVTSAGYVYPGPLSLIYWGLETVGLKAMNADGEKIEKLKLNFVAMLKLIEARHRMGAKTYIREMDEIFVPVRKSIEELSKTKTKKSGGVSNYVNLGLTEEGVRNLGQSCFTYVAKAFESKAIEEKRAAEFGREVMKFLTVAKLTSMSSGIDITTKLDEIMETFSEIYKNFQAKAKESNSKIRIDAKISLTANV